MSVPNMSSLPGDLPAEQGERRGHDLVGKMMSQPRRWIHLYSDLVIKKAQHVSQMESALRSLTYVIPGRFRDAEMASETLHTSVQLLSLYHDTVLLRACTGPTRGGRIVAVVPGRKAARMIAPGPHARYTRFWTARSALYRRAALLLRMVQYSELLWEMAAKRRGEAVRWRVVVVLEAVKALCRLLLLRITQSRPLVTPALPDREPVPVPVPDQDDGPGGPDPLAEMMGGEDDRDAMSDAHAHAAAHAREWAMPRTGTVLPSLPSASDIGAFLSSRVLTADDIKPAAKLLNILQGSGQAAEILHILAPLVYALALARTRDKKSWAPWVIGLGIELAARQLRDRSFRSTALERAEWTKRAWAMGWWAMRGAFYQNLTSGLVRGVKHRVPHFIGGIVEDYEYLWDKYYFSTSA